MSIAALSSAGSTQDAAAQRAPAPQPPSSVKAPIVDTRDRPAIDRIAALVKDEYDVNFYSDPTIDSEETETEGLSVYA